MVVISLCVILKLYLIICGQLLLDHRKRHFVPRALDSCQGTNINNNARSGGDQAT